MSPELIVAAVLLAAFGLAWVATNTWVIIEVQRLRSQIEVSRAYLPDPSLRSDGLTAWIWTSGHRLIGDRRTSSAVIAARVATIATLASGAAAFYLAKIGQP